MVQQPPSSIVPPIMNFDDDLIFIAVFNSSGLNWLFI